MQRVVATLAGIALVAEATAPPEDVEFLIPFRFPEVSENGRTLTLSVLVDYCGDFDGLQADVEDDVVAVAAKGSRAEGVFCELDCFRNYTVAHVASLEFDMPVHGFTLVEAPGTPLSCADGLGEPAPEQPVTWTLPD